jgi:hypothetical protein
VRFNKASGSSLDAGGNYSVAGSHARRIIFSVYAFFQKCMSEVERNKPDISRSRWVEAMQVGRL